MSDDAQREEVIRRRVRFVIPAREPWGLTIKDLQRAIREALAHREARGLSNEYDDCLRVLVEDSDGGEIVFFYDVEEPAPGAGPGPDPVSPCLHYEEHDVVIMWPPEDEEATHTIRVSARCCSRQACRTRLWQQIGDIVGHTPVVIPLP